MKKITTLKRITTSVKRLNWKTLFFTILTSIIIYACRQEPTEVIQPAGITIEEAKVYFNTNLAKNQKIIPNGRVDANLPSVDPDWESALVIGSTIEVPVRFGGTSRGFFIQDKSNSLKAKPDDISGITTLVLSKNQGKNFQQFFRTYIPDASFLKKQKFDFRKVNFGNLEASKFSGVILNQTYDEKFINGSKLVDGKEVSAISGLSKKKDSRNKRLAVYCEIEYFDVYQRVCVTDHGQIASCTDWELIDSYTTTSCTNDNPNGGGGGGNGGGGTPGGSSAEQQFMENYKLVGPDKPIANLSQKLNCFGTIPDDSRYKYSMTLYVDQPNNGSRGIINMSLPKRKPGHSYFGLERYDSQSGAVIRQVIGFYVESELSALTGTFIAGAWGDDSNSNYDVSLKTDLTASQFKDVVYNLKNGGTPDYHIVNNNCTTVAYGMLSPYINLPYGQGSFYRLGTGYNPADLGQDLRENAGQYGDKITIGNDLKSPQNVNCN
ncbi:hypothetical protein SAMN04515674_11989 [Pseudarcicella hirudinis]|uniref:DUF4105 domain-containing protein n=2 Tax=Pseudarcicella hirudinis TaxID=1079859 RepID=A0A1I5YKW5_9BACT|nr:hypothetical protein [Pseudarcicella hirudinis]SFQ44881.1 hypothetical protein SAMN04515674_11989 [Pseudarcicella hirudinis]